MQHLVQAVTQRLLSNLPDGTAYITPSELLSCHFPSFVVDRISIELKRNLAESIVPPNTDWAYMDNESVTEAWENFLVAIEAQVRLPFSFAASTIEMAVEELLEIMVEPRKNIPTMLFGTADTLDLADIIERSNYIAVHRHFADVLPRYMEKKGMSHLSKQKCADIIKQVDEKWCSSFTPLNWAQHLEPLFVLLGSDIEPEVFRKFFADKGNADWATLFDRQKSDINKTRLIELLSKPHLDVEELDWAEEVPEGDHNHDEEELSPAPLDVENNEPARLFQEKETIQPLQRATSPLLDQEIPSSEPLPRSGAVPIWQRFLSPDAAPAEQEDEDAPRVAHEGSLASRFAQHSAQDEEQPILDLSDNARGEDERSDAFRAILRMVDDERDYFVEEMFGGDENAFFDALEEIASFENWTEAGKYVVNEIFRRNTIEIYSDVAVLFTDRLQTYFLQR